MPKSHKLEISLQAGEGGDIVYKVICPEGDDPCKTVNGRCWITDTIHEIGLDALDVKTDIVIGTVPFTGYHGDIEEIWLEVGGED